MSNDNKKDNKKSEKRSWRKRISDEFAEAAIWSTVEEAFKATGKGVVHVIKSMFD